MCTYELIWAHMCVKNLTCASKIWELRSLESGEKEEIKKRRLGRRSLAAQFLNFACARPFFNSHMCSYELICAHMIVFTYVNLACLSLMCYVCNIFVFQLWRPFVYKYCILGTYCIHIHIPYMNPESRILIWKWIGAGAHSFLLYRGCRCRTSIVSVDSVVFVGAERKALSIKCESRWCGFSAGGGYYIC